MASIHAYLYICVSIIIKNHGLKTFISNICVYYIYRIWVTFCCLINFFLKNRIRRWVAGPSLLSHWRIPHSSFIRVSKGNFKTSFWKRCKWISTLFYVKGESQNLFYSIMVLPARNVSCEHWVTSKTYQQIILCFEQMNKKNLNLCI